MPGRPFGLDTPDPARARVLELGCASGGNLRPLAFHLPGGRYLLLDRFSTRLLDYLDETRDIAQLTRQLTDDIRQTRLVLPDLKPATPKRLQTQVRANIERCPRLFARQGVLGGRQA